MGLIKKPTEIEVRPKIKMLIYGAAGQGKTTLACGAPKPLLFDCDGGIHRINPAHIPDTVQATSYEEVLEVLNSPEIAEYETIIIDTGGKLLDMIGIYVIRRNPKLGRANGMLTLQGYGEVKAEFSQFCKLVVSKGKHLIFVAHRKAVGEDDNIRYIPLFGGSNYDALVTELDLVGYIEVTGNRPTITFTGTAHNDGKNTCNLPDIIDIPRVVDAQGHGLPNHFMENVIFAAYERHLQAIQNMAHAYAKVLEELKEEIELITDAPSANDFVARIDKFNHIGASKAAARELLRQKCSQLGLVYNKESRLYE